MYDSRSPSGTRRLAAELGAHILHARQRQGLSQERLADLAGVAPRSVYRVENGDAAVSVGVALAVLDALGEAEILMASLEEEAPRRRRTSVWTKAD